MRVIFRIVIIYILTGLFMSLLINFFGEEILTEYGKDILFIFIMSGVLYLILYQSFKKIIEQREIIEILYTNPEIGIIKTADDRTILEISESTALQLGYSAKELTGKSLLDLTFREETGEAELVMESQHPEDTCRLEKRYRHKEGNDIWFTLYGTPEQKREKTTYIISSLRSKPGKEREFELKKALTEKNALINNTRDLIWSIDPQLRVITFNNAYFDLVLKLTGKRIKSGDSALIEGYRQGKIRKWKAYYLQVLQGQSFTLEEEIRTDGTLNYGEISFDSIKDEKGNIIGISCHAKEVTNRKKAEMALKASEQKHKMLFDQNPVPLWIFDTKSYRFLRVNSSAINKYGYSRERFMAMTVTDLELDTKVGIGSETTGRISSGSIDIITRHKTNKGEIIDVHLYGQYIRYENKKAALVIANDITGMKQTEEKVLSAIIKTTEQERSRIARELHDSLTQNLTVASIHVKKLKEYFEDPSGNTLRDYELTLKHINMCIEESRNMAYNIMPKTIQDFGLVSSIEGLIENMKSLCRNCEIAFHYNMEFRLVGELEINLYRIVQEAFNNIVKHARATLVTVNLMFYEDVIELEILDNGVGFSASHKHLPFNSLGITSMRTRAVSIGATLNIESAPGEGTRVQVKLLCNLNDKVLNDKGIDS